MQARRSEHGEGAHRGAPASGRPAYSPAREARAASVCLGQTPCEGHRADAGKQAAGCLAHNGRGPYSVQLLAVVSPVS